MTSTLIDNIGELVTCDGPPDDPLGVRSAAAVVIQDTEIAWIGPAPWPRGRRADRRPGERRSFPASSTVMPISCSQAIAPRSSPRGWQARPTPRAASAPPCGPLGRPTTRNCGALWPDWSPS